MAEKEKSMRVKWRNGYVGTLKESLAKIYASRGQLEILGEVTKEEKIHGLKESKELPGEKAKDSKKVLTGAEGEGKVTDSVKLGK
jgi:hypothetical protein